MLLPQEIEVWYVLPALRKELCKSLIELGASQRDAAEIFGISEAAVSYYIRNKRAVKVKFDKTFKEKIQKIALLIANNKITAYTALQILCKDFRRSGHLCALHKRLEKIDLPFSCKEKLIKICRG